MNPAEPQTILIVDDHPLFRKGVIQLIQAAPEFRFVGEAASGRHGIQLAHSLHPDMILLDLNMKDMNGVEVLKQGRRRALTARRAGPGCGATAAPAPGGPGRSHRRRT